MPSYDSSSNQTPQPLIQHMTRGQCEAEETRILTLIEKLQGAITKDPRSAFIVDQNANKKRSRNLKLNSKRSRTESQGWMHGSVLSLKRMWDKVLGAETDNRSRHRAHELLILQLVVKLVSSTLSKCFSDNMVEESSTPIVSIFGYPG
ncbi:hypothetical protein BGAL_0018g00140 [Botrytis galanthina]|uniref:Uncharacterized protein n=1 Tax=Botrytis galanthina TaxID=278940 RepID=A0A4S8R9Z4_9HELO|nr:hypothetical protein BGAL_0018g00140 [Botrytis galanthina]